MPLEPGFPKQLMQSEPKLLVSKENQHFLSVNLGPRKNYRIYEGKLKYWLNKRPAKERRAGSFIPTADEILEELDL